MDFLLVTKLAWVFLWLAALVVTMANERFASRGVRAARSEKPLYPPSVELALMLRFVHRVLFPVEVGAIALGIFSLFTPTPAKVSVTLFNEVITLMFILASGLFAFLSMEFRRRQNKIIRLLEAYKPGNNHDESVVE